jgi:hypothetical protein
MPLVPPVEIFSHKMCLEQGEGVKKLIIQITEELTIQTRPVTMINDVSAMPYIVEKTRPCNWPQVVLKTLNEAEEHDNKIKKSARLKD